MTVLLQQRLSFFFLSLSIDGLSSHHIIHVQVLAVASHGIVDMDDNGVVDESPQL